MFAIELQIKIWIFFFLTNCIQCNHKFSKKTGIDTIKWSELGLRNVCNLIKFMQEYSKIEDQFKKCLHVENLILDLEEYQYSELMIDNVELFDEHVEEKSIKDSFNSITYSKEHHLNSFCKLSKYWKKCVPLIVNLACIEPNPNKLRPLYIPKPVQHHLQRLYKNHLKELNKSVINFEENYLQLHLIKLEQLNDLFKTRCIFREQLHIDNLKTNTQDYSPFRISDITKWQHQALPDIY